MRRSFQFSLLLVAFLPLALGMMTLILGAARFVPPDQVTPMLDSQLRFYGARSIMTFLLAIWIVRNMDSADAVLAIVFCTTAFGALARAYSAMEFGLPTPISGGIIAFELALLLFIPWHRAAVR
ncbi:MAG: DUF4345 family protein, partial [Pseudomonadota bacterium]